MAGDLGIARCPVGARRWPLRYASTKVAGAPVEDQRLRQLRFLWRLWEPESWPVCTLNSAVFRFRNANRVGAAKGDPFTTRS